MKKLLTMSLFILLLTVSTSVAFASLDDTMTSIEAQYGQCRLIVDTDSQIWTKIEWDAKGSKRAKAASHSYSFARQGLSIQMEVMYNGDKPTSRVNAQRFTPAMAIKVKDLKTYFPEVYQLIQSPKAEVFATYKNLSRNFQEEQSPATMGVVIKLSPSKLSSYYTVLAFNIQDEGRLIKDIKYIDGETYIREFTIEKALKLDATDNLDSGDWKRIKNYF